METVLLDLIGLIYDAAQDQARWPAFLERYRAAVKCHIAQLELIKYDQSASISASVGLEQSDFPDFLYYSRISPWIPLVLKAEQGDVGLSHEVVPDREYRKSEYYQGFGRRIDQHYGLAGIVLKSPAMVSVIGSVRYGRLGSSTEDDRKLLQALMPHLARSLRMQTEFMKLEAQAASLLDCLDQLARGFVILDQRGRVVRANRAAERMAGQLDGLHLSCEGLGAAVSKESAALQKLIHEAAQSAAGCGLSSGGTIVISRPSGRRPWIAVVSPHKVSDGKGYAAVLLIDQEETPQPSARIVAQLFGFTHSETKLALLLAQGIRLEDASIQLKITMNTARTHTRRILDKTGLRRQTDLVLLLNKLPGRYL